MTPPIWMGTMAAAMAVGGIRGVFAGGYNTNRTVMDYISIDTDGNATDCGDLSTQFAGGAGAGNSTRGLFAGGYFTNTLIQYITIATAGTSTNFGNLTLGRGSMGAMASSTRCVFQSGSPNAGGVGYSTIDYVTIATTGNATDFGDDWAQTYYKGSACSNATRGVMQPGGYPGGWYSMLGYIAIATTGNAAEFGSLSQGLRNSTSLSNTTRAIIHHGYYNEYVESNTLEYVTIATTGNATDFGDMVNSGPSQGGVASELVGVMGSNGANLQNLYKITLATTGNASYFGQLSVSRDYYSGVSNRGWT